MNPSCDGLEYNTDHGMEEGAPEEDDRQVYDDADSEPDDQPNPGPNYLVETLENDEASEEKAWGLIVAVLAILGAVYEPSIAHGLTILAGMVTLMHYMRR